MNTVIFIAAIILCLIDLAALGVILYIAIGPFERKSKKCNGVKVKNLFIQYNDKNDPKLVLIDEYKEEWVLTDKFSIILGSQSPNLLKKKDDKDKH